MKKIGLFFSLVFFLSISFQINAQWFWQNPLPQGNHLYSVHFIDNQTGWATGDNRTILKTTTGGENWISQSSGIGKTYYLRSVHFIDNQIGWAVGSYFDGETKGSILKTTNGGDDWVSQFNGTSNGFVSVCFTDDQTGWTVVWVWAVPY